MRGKGDAQKETGHDHASTKKAGLTMEECQHYNLNFTLERNKNGHNIVSGGVEPRGMYDFGKPTKADQRKKGKRGIQNPPKTPDVQIGGRL